MSYEVILQSLQGLSEEELRQLAVKCLVITGDDAAIHALAAMKGYSQYAWIADDFRKEM